LFLDYQNSIKMH